ncbi:T9SS type A sorting domain-containing protein [Fluviicola sp.]|uniref:T9SS type A sorting domain-containing protein n=1 Tax=Fluviicola sp. TaxID=1917219 RepID=UPI00261B9BD4|nr:T9SS type A sorting domain-containing protein [Fluviicola sp.]
MKAKKLKQILIPGFILFCQQAFGQLPSIDSLKIIPDNPTANDEINVICYATFSSGGCDLMNHSITILGNQITLNLEYMEGSATYICHSVDTISLGNLRSGDYYLRTDLSIQPSNQVLDSDSTSFFVDNPLRTSENGTISDLTIYPNPFTDEIQIKTDAMIEKVELKSVSGQQIYLKENDLNPEKTITVPDLKNGVYLLVLTDHKGNKHTQRIIKN